MGVREDILEDATIHSDYTPVLDDDELTDGDRGFVDGVDYALRYLGIVGVNDGWNVVDAIAGHRSVPDDIPRCSCGRGFATMRDLTLHIADEVSAPALADGEPLE